MTSQPPPPPAGQYGEVVRLDAVPMGGGTYALQCTVCGPLETVSGEPQARGALLRHLNTTHATGDRS